MSPNPREVRQLADEILSAEEHLALLRTRWDALFSSIPGVIPTTKIEAELAQGYTRQGSTASRILTFMNQNFPMTWTPTGLSDALEIPKDKVDSSLYNLYVAKKIARPERGTYQPLVPETMPLTPYNPVEELLEELQ